MRLTFTQSARRHRIGKAHARYVMETHEPFVTTNHRGEREYAWIGVDDRGVELEVTGAVLEGDLLLIFHVMPTAFRRKS